MKMDESEERRCSVTDDYTLPDTATRHFSHLNLPDRIACYLPAINKCPTTTGLQNSHTELLSLLLMDSIFRDFFNVYLLLPIHAHQCIVKQSNEGSFIQCYPLYRGTGNRLSVDRMLQWLYSNRLPFFLSSRLYQLCLFTHSFCTNNRYLDFDETVEYSKKQLNMFGDMRTVEGIQKLIRYAGSSPDGIMIQLWLDLQWLRHTDKDHGHNDMMKQIRDNYSSKVSKLPQEFKMRLIRTVQEVGNVSLNSCLVTKRTDLLTSYDILLQNPFINRSSSENKTLAAVETNPLYKLQKDIMADLKGEFCKRYLTYHNCLPANVLEEDFKKVDKCKIEVATSSTSDQNIIETHQDKESQKEDGEGTLPGKVEKPDKTSDSEFLKNDDEDRLETIIEVDNDDKDHELLAAGRSKSTLPQVSESMFTELQSRPKTAYPNLHPKIPNLSRLSGKTSGYFTMTSPDDRLASPMTIDHQLRRCKSLPNIETASSKFICSLLGEEGLSRSISQTYLTEDTKIIVNETAVKRIIKFGASLKEGINSQESTASMSLDMSIDKQSTSPDIRPITRNESALNNDSPSSVSIKDPEPKKRTSMISRKSSNITPTWQSQTGLNSESQSMVRTGSGDAIKHKSSVTVPKCENSDNTLSRKSIPSEHDSVYGDGKKLSTIASCSSNPIDSSNERTSASEHQDDFSESERSASRSSYHSDQGSGVRKIHSMASQENLKSIQMLPSLTKRKGQTVMQNPESDQQTPVILDTDMSVAIRRKTVYQDTMQKRKCSSFIRSAAATSQKSSHIYQGSEQEKRAASDKIIKDKTPESMLAQDKRRVYVSLVASDQLAGGPFRNYLTFNNHEQLVDYLTLWENIEVVRCITNEGGRRGASAKSFGGNGFLSCHDEWPVIRDDPYFQYHESLKKINRYNDSWKEFHLKFDLLQEFFSVNRIRKPYDMSLIRKHVDELNNVGCHDEILALAQDHLVTKLKKELEKYYKFDSENFYHYLSYHDDQFHFEVPQGFSRDDRFMSGSINRNRGLRKSRPKNIMIETIFSPLSRRLWVAMDICEKMIFPFALRKLSMPMLNLSSMITMKMFIMRRRKEKEKEKLAAQKAGIVAQKKVTHKKKKKPKLKKVNKKKVSLTKLFYIDWDSKISAYNSRLSDTLSHLKSINNLKNASTAEFAALSPPSIDDMFLQDPSIKNFRRFIIRRYRGSEKEHKMNVANCMVAIKEISGKLDLPEYPDLSKGVCTQYIFNKNSILHDMHLPDEIMKIISKKKCMNPTFLILIDSVIQSWLYKHCWKSFISNMYSTKIDYKQFYSAKRLVTWKATTFNKPLCKRLFHFISKVSNFLNYLSVPSQFDEFRDFLASHRLPQQGEDQRRDRKFGKGLIVDPNRLPYDLYFLIEIFVYKNLLLSSRQAAKDLSTDGSEEQALFEKVELILEIFLDSQISPRLQVNIPNSLAIDIMLCYKKMNLCYTLFNEATCYILQALLFFWKKYSIHKYAPNSNKKSKMLYEYMDGKPLPMPYSMAYSRKKSRPSNHFIPANSSRVSCLDNTEKFKFQRGSDIGGFNFTITYGYREIYRSNPINLGGLFSIQQINKQLKKIRSQKSQMDSNAIVGKPKSPLPGDRNRIGSVRMKPTSLIDPKVAMNTLRRGTLPAPAYSSQSQRHNRLSLQIPLRKVTHASQPKMSLPSVLSNLS